MNKANITKLDININMATDRLLKLQPLVSYDRILNLNGLTNSILHSLNYQKSII